MPPRLLAGSVGCLVLGDVVKVIAMTLVVASPCGLSCFSSNSHCLSVKLDCQSLDVLDLMIRCHQSLTLVVSPISPPGLFHFPLNKIIHTSQNDRGLIVKMELLKDNVPVFVFVIGAPGAGKGTLCQKLASGLYFYHLSLGDALRKVVKDKPDSELARNVKPYITTETLIPDDMLREFLDQHILPGVMECGKLGVLIDGFPRAASQIPCWTGPAPRLVLSFDCPKEIAAKRVIERGRGGLPEKELAEIFEKRYGQFKAEKDKILQEFGYLKDDEGVFFGYEGILQDVFTVELNKSMVVRIDTSGSTEASWQTLLEELERSTRWRSVTSDFHDLYTKISREQEVGGLGHNPSENSEEGEAGSVVCAAAEDHGDEGDGDGEACEGGQDQGDWNEEIEEEEYEENDGNDGGCYEDEEAEDEDEDNHEGEDDQEEQ